MEHLDAYCSALPMGWSPDNLRPDATQDELAEIAQYPGTFLSRLEDLQGQGPPVILPDASSVPRLPSLKRWIWTNGFCGSIALRWLPGTDDLPPTCLGHIGYAVVPWRRREGLATAALKEMLLIAHEVGLQRVDLTADAYNTASIGVISGGGRYVKTFITPEQIGGHTDALYRIDL
jgi:predicted acetyltransferase